MKNMLAFSDTELIRLLPKQSEAFDVLFLRYKKDLNNVVVHYIKDKHAAEDMVQEAFLKIYLSLKAGRYNEEGKFLPWALRIVRNLCMDHLRKAKHTTITLANEKEDAIYLTAGHGGEDNLVKKEQQQQLNRLISELSNEQQQLVSYRYYHKLSFKEIAGLMDTSINTSLGRMRYALGHLRKQIVQNPSFAWR